MTTHSQPTPDVGFIGLGVMGSAMAANLIASRPLLVWNRSTGASDRLADAGAQVARSPAEVFERSSTVFLMLADEDATEEVLRFDDGLLEDTLVVLMSTVRPEYSESLSRRVRGAGGRYVEAPVSGSRQPAVDGQLVAMVAGEDEDLEHVTPLLAPMCSAVFRCGAPPKALAMKFAVNTFLITLVTGLAESFHFAEQQGLDLEMLEAVLGAGPMASSVSRAKAAKLVHQDQTVHASIPDALKNANLIIGEARRSQSATPLIDACAELFSETHQLLDAPADMAFVISAFRERTRRTQAQPAAMKKGPRTA